MRSHSKKPAWQLRIAKERIGILFTLAGKEFPEHPERSNRYVELSRKIAKRYNIKLSKVQRKRFCKHCCHYLKPGVNSRVRTRSSQQAVVITCKDCGRVERFPYRKEKAAFKY